MLLVGKIIDMIIMGVCLKFRKKIEKKTNSKEKFKRILLNLGSTEKSSAEIYR